MDNINVGSTEKRNLVITRLLSIPKFAEAIGISSWLARKLVHNGEIPFIKVGGQRKIDSRWVESWLQQAQSSLY